MTNYMRLATWASCIAVLVLTSALTGCGGPMLFATNGTAKNSLTFDAYECKQQWERSAGAIAFRQDPIGNAFYAIDSRNDLQECMEHRGWQRVK